MITIGFRASADDVTFAVYDAEKRALLNVENVRLPLALGRPDALKLMRSNVLDVLREYDVQKAGIRTTEPNAQSVSTSRVEIEGVLQETFASSNLESYYVGQISTITHKIGIERTSFKEYVNGPRIYKEVENWNDLSKESREAVLCAIGAVNA